MRKELKGFSYLGLGGLWGANDVNKKPEPEPKGLEIIIGDAPIDIRLDGKHSGYIIHYEKSNSYEAVILNVPQSWKSEDLKAIATKLDELNGVNIDREKLENELRMLMMRGTRGMSGSDIEKDMIRMKEIRDILNNP